jgi:hypothetical protein
MVDKIKSPSPVQKNLQSEQANVEKAKSPESLRQGFQTLSTSLSVSDRFIRDQKPLKVETRRQEDSRNASPEVKVSSLDDAVRYSREALNALEQVTAGGLNSQTVSSLLSEEEDSSVDIPERSEAKRTRVGELAEDLDTLKTNLRDLFIALKEKADKSNVTISNREASNPGVEDLRLATELARNASKEIKFHPDNALEVHSGIDLNSVTRLLREKDERIL